MRHRIELRGLPAWMHRGGLADQGGGEAKALPRMTMWLMIGLLMINILLMAFNLMKEFGLFQNRDFETECAYLIMRINLLFKKKIMVRPRIEHYSPRQATENFYLVKIYKCSHERHFKLMSGSYTTIVPESGIFEIDGVPLHPNPNI